MLLCTYKFVACLYMLCNILHTVPKLQGSLQSKDLDLSMVPMMVQTTISRLRELKDHPSSSTWFKDHSLVFSDPKQLGELKIQITESDRKSFIQRVYNPYIQSVIDHYVTHSGKNWQSAKKKKNSHVVRHIIFLRKYFLYKS